MVVVVVNSSVSVQEYDRYFFPSPPSLKPGIFGISSGVAILTAGGGDSDCSSS